MKQMFTPLCFSGIWLSSWFQEHTDQISQSSIVGGQNADIQKFYAGIVMDSNPEHVICGATFIKTDTLLTAAHCVDDIPR